MTAYHAVVADRKDLAVVTVVCPNEKCQAKTSFDVARKQEPMDRNAGKIPEACPSCSTRFDENAIAAMRALANFHSYGAAAETAAGKPIFQFEIKSEPSIQK